jgi:hypothetical protein
VIKFTSRAQYEDSYLGDKKRGAVFTGPGFRKAANVFGFLSVGAVSTDPQKYTKVGAVLLVRIVLVCRFD